jgi:cobalt-zinc-cadmium efflux system membrane fusion protein
MKRFTHFLLFIMIFSINSSVLAKETHINGAVTDSHVHEEHEGREGIEEHEDVLETRIKHSIAGKVGIETARVSSKTLNQFLPSYGNLTISPEQLSHVTARFPGLIRSVNVNIGEDVKKGKLLAKVESNDSLRTYAITSPIDGRIIQRHANTGEFTSDQVLFSIANFDTLWAEFRIYPTHRSQVASGLYVDISINDTVVEGVIAHIIPAVNHPYQFARVKIDNKNLGLSPGMLIEGNIAIAQFNVDRAVLNDAVQIMEGEEGVFVKRGESYTFTPIKLGRKDENYTEVLSGVTADQEYVASNSYLIKADIEKSEAEHVH